MKDYDDPFDDFEDDYEEDPKETEELVNRFRESIEEGNHEYFDDDQTESIILYALHTMDFELAEQALKYAVETFPTDSYFRILKVRKCMLTFDIKAAEEELEKIERMFAPTSDFYLQKALLIKMQDENADVMELLHKAELLDPDDPELLFMLATEHLRKGKVRKAFDYTERALVNDETMDEQLFTFSYLFDETKQYDKALEFFTMLTDRFPLSKGAWFALALAYSSLNEHEKSIEANRYVLSIDETTSTAYYNIANSYFDMKKYDLARENYQLAYDLDPDDYISLTGIGDCYYITGDTDMAMSYYQKVRDINPNHINAITGILSILKDQGRMEEANAFIEKAFSLCPQSFNLLFAVLPFYQPEQQKEKIRQLFKLTFDQVENKSEFFNFFVLYCCHHEEYELGLELIRDFLDEEFPEIPYYMAALHYLNKEECEGEKYLKIALLTDFDDHRMFLSLDEKLADIPRIAELIELYKPE